MAFGEPPRDAYGNPISIPPHNQVIIGPDGLPTARRTKLILGSGLTCTDVPETDGTRIDVDGGSNSIIIVDSVSSIRSLSRNPDSNVLYRTRGSISPFDGGGAFYRWDASSVDDDDGVLILKVMSRSAGRMRYVNIDPSNMYCALSAVPALGDNTRSVSFDPSGTIAMRSEFYRVTKILRNNGFSGITFPSGRYLVFGDENVGGSLLPNVPFRIELLGSATFFNPDTTGSKQFGIFAQGEVQLLTLGYTSRHWTQSITGSAEHVFSGVADVSGLSVGQTVFVRYGADKTDASGWCAFWSLDTITNISGSTVTVLKGAPMPTPVGVGINTQRTQGEHDMIVMTEFQDDTQIVGGYIENMFFTSQGSRRLLIDVQTSRSISLFMNMFACTDMHYPGTMVVQHAEGSITAGELFDLQSCYNTRIGGIVIDFANNPSPQLLGILSEELNCHGTTIGLIDVTCNPNVGATAMVAQTPGQVDIIRIDHLIVKGLASGCTVCSNASIGTFENLSGSSQSVPIRMDQCERVLFRGQSYTGKKSYDCSLDLPTSGTKVFTFPVSGLVRRLTIKPSTLTGITDVHIKGNGAGDSYDITTGFLTSGQWCDINPGALISVSSPNYDGYTSLRISVTSDGTTPAGSFFAVEVEMFVPDLVGSSLVSTTFPMVLSGSGPPSFNADFVGQEYRDSVGLNLYDSVQTGTGSTDWKIRGTFLPDVVAPGVYGNAAMVPFITLDSKGRTTGISGVGIAIAAGQVSGLSSIATDANAPVILENTDYNSSSHTVNWTSGAYRRIIIRMDVAAGGSATDPQLTLTGITTGTYNSVNVYNATSVGGQVQVDQTNADFYNMTLCGQNSFVEMELFIRTGPLRGILMRASSDLGGSFRNISGSGISTDFTSNVTGFVITFAANTQGHIEVIGCP